MISSSLDVFIYIFKHILTLFGFKKFPIPLKCLNGKTAIVTGGNSGIGFAIAKTLASRGCKVILADCQNGELQRDQIMGITGNMNIVYKHLDLSSLQSVRNFASDICRTEDKIDILINNAGIGLTRKTVSEDGLNYLMQVNIFGAFLLTHLLLDPLRKSGSANVVFTSSVASFLHSLTLETLNPTDFQMNDDYRVALYSNSKMCNILVAQQFGKRLKKYGITVNSIDPIGAKTKIFTNIGDLTTWWAYFTGFLLFFVRLDIMDIASNYVHVITQTGSEIRTGENFVLSTIGRKPKILKNEQFCEDIWSKMEELVELKSEDKIRHVYTKLKNYLMR